MSGAHHKRTGWTYGPRPRGTCLGCFRERTLTKAGRLVSHRAPGRTPHLCAGSGELPGEAVARQLGRNAASVLLQLTLTDRSQCRQLRDKAALHTDPASCGPTYAALAAGFVEVMTKQLEGQD